MAAIWPAPLPGGQLLQAMFRQRTASLEQVLTLPATSARKWPRAGWTIERPRIVETFRSIDGTERYLVAGEDSQTVETVWMPGGDGAARQRGKAPSEPPSAFRARLAAR